MTTRLMARLKRGSDIFLFGALLATVLVFGLLFLSQQESQDAQIAELVRTTSLPDESESLSPAPRPLPTPATPVPKPVSAPVNSLVPPSAERDTFAQALDQCLAADPKFDVVRGSVDLSEVVASLERGRVTRNEREVENYHYRMPDQTERRLQIIYEETPNAPAMIDAHLFTVSSDGIPIPTELPEDFDENPSPESIASLTQQGQVFFHQLRRHLVLDNDLYAEIETINEIANEVVIRTENFSFVCVRRNCRCLQ